MRRRELAAAAALGVLVVAGCGSDGDGDGGDGGGGGSGQAGSAESTEAGAAESTGDAVDAAESSPAVAADVAAMRAATAEYADDLEAALDEGYFMITRHMPDQGYHFLNPNVEGFDPSVPQILMYAHDGDAWELVAFEWVWPEEPEEPPMDGATYGSFPAACHYDDGLFIEAAAEDDCAGQHPDSQAGFTFWHPDLVTLHVWAWLHNPDGLYNPTNPLMSVHNDDADGAVAADRPPGRGFLK